MNKLNELKEKYPHFFPEHLVGIVLDATSVEKKNPNSYGNYEKTKII